MRIFGYRKGIYMSLKVQNIKTTKYVAPAIFVGAAAVAQHIVRKNENTGTFSYPYNPEQNLSNKSAEESAKAIILAENSKDGIFYYPYVPEHHHAAKSPEEAQKLKDDCIYAFTHDFRVGKFVKKEVTREDGRLFGRITKIVKYFEYPDYTWEKTFEYSGPESIKITSDCSRSSIRNIEEYKDGLRTESATINKETGKYLDRELYKYDSEGRISERLHYDRTLSKIEYIYDSQNRIIEEKTTITAIPEDERSEYSYPFDYVRKSISLEEYQYDQDNNPVLVSRTSEIERGNGEMWKQKVLHPENTDMEKYFYDPNTHSKLITKNLYK